MILSLIEEFQLDNRETFCEQFIIAKKDNVILGFVRVRAHATCNEICSLGVIESMRNKGIAELLINSLTKRIKDPCYLVCIIPEFFNALGFNIALHYPLEMKDKLDYCTSELTVAKEYVVMKRDK